MLIITLNLNIVSEMNSKNSSLDLDDSDWNGRWSTPAR